MIAIAAMLHDDPGVDERALDPQRPDHLDDREERGARAPSASASRRPGAPPSERPGRRRSRTRRGASDGADGRCGTTSRSENPGRRCRGCRRSGSPVDRLTIRLCLASWISTKSAWLAKAPTSTRRGPPARRRVADDPGDRDLESDDADDVERARRVGPAVTLDLGVGAEDPAPALRVRIWFARQDKAVPHPSPGHPPRLTQRAEESTAGRSRFKTDPEATSTAAPRRPRGPAAGACGP